MNSIFLVAIFATIVPFTLIGAEPSAFGAGNLDNPKPYGLTSSEKVILQNKKTLKKISVKSNNQSDKVDSLRERIDGLQTIIEGLSQKSQENKLKITQLNRRSDDELSSSNEYEQRLSDISQANSQSIQTSSQTIDSIKLTIGELSTLVESIENSYVSKDEFNRLVDDFNRFKSLVAKELKQGSRQKKSKYNKKSTSEIATQAKKNYDKKYYTKSIEQYLYLIEKNYKPARAHYMVGEMYYYRKNYSDAIAYFKKSVSLYSKASYMPTLMLHTAVAMQKTGDKKNAKSFYKGVISKYPDTKHADTAKSKLKNMK